MLFDQDTIKQIQAIAFDAYKTTGRVAALLDKPNNNLAVEYCRAIRSLAPRIGGLSPAPARREPR